MLLHTCNTHLEQSLILIYLQNDYLPPTHSYTLQYIAINIAVGRIYIDLNVRCLLSIYITVVHTTLYVLIVVYVIVEYVSTLFLISVMYQRHRDKLIVQYVQYV